MLPQIRCKRLQHKRCHNQPLLVAFLQDRARKRHKRQKCDVVCDKHTGKKHKKQAPASAARYFWSLPEAGCRSHRTVRCSEILPQSASATAKCRARASQCSPRTADPGAPECRCHSEGCGDREYRFFFIKSVIFCNMLSIIFSVSL